MPPPLRPIPQLSGLAMSTAAEIHHRLIHPANSVPDQGIDLKRLPRGYFFQEKKKPEPPQAIEYHPIAKVINGNLILTAVSSAFGLGIKDILGTSRKSKVAMARHVTIYFMYTHIPNMSLAMIGIRLDRDHSSILHGRDKIKNLLTQDSPTASFIRSIETSLLG